MRNLYALAVEMRSGDGRILFTEHLHAAQAAFTRAQRGMAFSAA